MSLYLAALIVHLICAILFIGVVFFEVILLEGVRKRLGDELMDRFESALIGRARMIMPFVVALLFLSGGTLLYHYFDTLDFSWSNAFTVLLSIKIVLAFSVLAHFVTALTAHARGHMSSRRFQLIHFSVATHMLVIVLLAKLMFYISW